jgi:hypothetical protein
VGSAERILADEIRELRREKRELQQQVGQLLDRIMYLTGKPYAPTPLELADVADELEPTPEDPDFPGFTASREAVGL